MDYEFILRHDDSGIDPEIEAIAREVIGAAIEVHRVLGLGFPESVYRKALSHELDLRFFASSFATPRLRGSLSYAHDHYPKRHDPRSLPGV
jgi:hypothetical protein